MNKFSTFLWRSAFWLRYKWWFGAKVYGRDKFPMEGPVIVVPNHLSNNDPPMFGGTAGPYRYIRNEKRAYCSYYW